MTPSPEREPQHIPAWVDKARLCQETCLADRTVDILVKTGQLPPPRKVGRKLLWRWAEVDRYLDHGGAGETESVSPFTPEAIRANTERLLRAQRR